ncbi:MAG: Rieske (2Fe-2S) protein, partial [Opitutae bacterium]
GDQVVSYNLRFTHLGCAIDYRKDSNDYFCPCHNSTFGLDGSVTNDDSPSPRGMDTMETKVEDGQVWIQFQQFRPNIAEKIPLS